MDRRRTRFPIAMRLCSIVLFTLFVAASARAQTPRTAPATDAPSEAEGGMPFLSRSSLPFAPSGAGPLPASDARPKIGKEVSRELDKAWRISGDGATNRECVVLIFRMKDGTYVGKSLGFTNEYKKFTFRWDPAALAIVHTHPNGSDPKPAEQDRRVADKYGVPNFTITISGMYVYDPATKKTSKVLNGLDWLNLSAYPDEFKRWLGE